MEFRSMHTHAPVSQHGSSSAQPANTLSLVPGFKLFAESLVLALLVSAVIHLDARYIDGMVGE